MGSDEFGEPTTFRASHTESPDDTERKLVLLVTNVMAGGGILELDLPSRGKLTVGRSPTSELCVESPSVSRAHAVLEITSERLTLRDLGSTNGTFVNGRRIAQEPFELGVEDALRFGDVVAHFQRSRASRVLLRHAVAPRDWDVRLDEEADRCVRYDRSLAVLAISAPSPDGKASAVAEQAVLTSLRPSDAATIRSAGRIDVLAPECSKDEAVVLARRICGLLGELDVEGARIGVATFPGDVATAHTLPVAAEIAMQDALAGQIGLARAGARMIPLGNNEIIVAEPAVVRLFALIERVATSDLSVLVHGETGSGKEIVAEAVHRWGPRCDRPLVKLNCAAVPENLLESELFGYERGAFSGADRVKPGLFEEADGGTLFLDEIGDMPLAMQAKLLRVLEDKRVRRLGANRDATVDIRIVAATHRDLASAATEGSFREDLFYRLSAVVLRIPPLRERGREIGLLAQKFAAEACERAKREPVTIGAKALGCLRAYAWPGNIRELRNVIGAAVMMSEGTEVLPEHLPPQIAGLIGTAKATAARRAETAPPSRPALTLEEEVRALERARIIEALEACGGNQTKAAEYLGIPRRTLVYKLTALDIARKKS